MVWEDDYDIIITIIFYLSNFRGLFWIDFTHDHFLVRKKKLHMKCRKNDISDTADTIQAKVYAKRYTTVFDCTIWTSEGYIQQRKA